MDQKLSGVLAAKIQEKINSGEYYPGEQMKPIRFLSSQFGVSNCTAAKAVQELIQKGVLKSIPRKGTFVNTLPRPSLVESEMVPLQRVLLYCDQGAMKKHSFSSDIVNGVFERTAEAGIGFQTELCESSDIKGVSFQAGDYVSGDGIIVVTGQPGMVMLAALSSKNIRRVLVDSVFSMSPSILNDNVSGIRQLLEYYKVQGHKHIIYSWGSDPNPNPVNENERREAALGYAAELGIHIEAVEKDNPADLIPLFADGSSYSAIMFSKDDPAIRFIEEARSAGISVPGQISVSGFDDFSQCNFDLSELTTVKVKRKELGYAAFELLQNSIPGSKTYCTWTRIPCDLVIRNSIGLCKR